MHENNMASLQTVPNLACPGNNMHGGETKVSGT